MAQPDQRLELAGLEGQVGMEQPMDREAEVEAINSFNPTGHLQLKRDRWVARVDPCAASTETHA